jgi:hypothetical protein
MVLVDYKTQLLSLAQGIIKQFPAGQLVIGKYLRIDDGALHILHLKFGFDDDREGICLCFESMSYLLRSRMETEDYVRNHADQYYFMINPWPSDYTDKPELLVRMLSVVRYIMSIRPNAVLAYNDESRFDYNKDSSVEYESGDKCVKLPKNKMYNPIKQYLDVAQVSL